MAPRTSPQSAPIARRGRILLAGLLLALGVVVLPSTPAEAATHRVVIKQYVYGPGSLSITQGDTVTWTNQDSVQHDVVVTDGPASFRSPLLSKGKSWSHTFTAAGTYTYTCSIHPDMRASVTVKAKTTTAAQPSTSPTASSHEHDDAEKESTKSEATPSPSPTAVPAGTSVTPTAQQTSTLNPFLLLLGASTAVVVFCLLLMSSRPQHPAPEGPVVDEDQP